MNLVDFKRYYGNSEFSQKDRIMPKADCLVAQEKVIE